MPETPEEIYARAAGALRMPPVTDWVTFPFVGDLALRELSPPTESERVRSGEGGENCHTCTDPGKGLIWSNDRWLVTTTKEPTGLPIVLFLMPREHHPDPSSLPDELARDQGVMLGRVEKAILSIGHIGRVHISRWGDGSEHLHWWFIARPERLTNLLGTFCVLWEEVLPPTPEPIWRDNIARVVRALEASEPPA